MLVTQEQYIDAKKTLEAVQRLPAENQRAILNMLYGAIAISEMYSLPAQAKLTAKQESA